MSINCQLKVQTKNSKFLGGKPKYTICRKSAPKYFYFDGRDTLSLCAEHAFELSNTGLSVKEKTKSESFEKDSLSKKKDDES